MRPQRVLQAIHVAVAVVALALIALSTSTWATFLLRCCLHLSIDAICIEGSRRRQIGVSVVTKHPRMLVQARAEALGPPSLQNPDPQICAPLV
jgi:hypothetical protein